MSYHGIQWAAVFFFSKVSVCFFCLASKNEFVDLCIAGNLSRINRQRRSKNAIFPVGQNGQLELATNGGPNYFVKELTVDHHADREDERSRIEAAGGYVVEWAGVVRVNGELAVSRAIGDMAFKK